jgi:hypothetical protein
MARILSFACSVVSTVWPRPKMQSVQIKENLEILLHG